MPTRFWKTANNLGRRAIARGMSKRARFAGRRDLEAQRIEFDLDGWSAGHGIQFTDPLWWAQEQELLRAKGKNMYGEWHSYQEDEWRSCQEDEWRPHQEVYNYKPHAHDYDFDDYDEDWIYQDHGRYDDPEPQDAAWKYLWLCGAVNTPELYELDNDPRRENDFDFDEDFDRDEDFYYDGWYSTQQEECDFLATSTPDVHHTEDPAYWRNIERHRAGKRFFRQHGRSIFNSVFNSILKRP